MLNKIKQIYRSIAFLPFLIAFGFGVLAIILIVFPIQAKGTLFDFLSITKKETVETILSFVIGGLFTLTVFSYTMVMNVLNRSISNFSPRLIPLLLSQRNHKLILGVTTGTIVYGLVLAIFVSNDSERVFPDLAAALALLFAIACVGLFIYFLHTVSQSIHVNYVIKESFNNTYQNLHRQLDEEAYYFDMEESTAWPYAIKSKTCGYLQQVQLEYLSKVAAKHDFKVKIIPVMGTFVLQDEILLQLSKKPDEKLEQKIWRAIAVDLSESMDVSEIGFKHLVEVAIKASSPSINDPGTSLTALDYLTQLFIIRSKIKPHNAFQKNGGTIFYSSVAAEKLFYLCFVEMKRYMKDDPVLIIKLKNSLATINAQCSYIKKYEYSDF